jgi:hypothetical protein
VLVRPEITSNRQPSADQIDIEMRCDPAERVAGIVGPRGERRIVQRSSQEHAARQRETAFGTRELSGVRAGLLVERTRWPACTQACQARDQVKHTLGCTLSRA